MEIFLPMCRIREGMLLLAQDITNYWAEPLPFLSSKTLSMMKEKITSRSIVLDMGNGVLSN